MKAKIKRAVRYVPGAVLQILFFLLLLATFSLLWAKENYGNIGFEEIVFTLSMPLEGTESGLISDYLIKALLPSCVIWVIAQTAVHFPFDKQIYISVSRWGESFKIWLCPFRISPSLRVLLVIAWVGAVLYTADQAFSLREYITSMVQSSSFIEEEYVDPGEVEITFPEKKRNLICIYVESGESSLQDTANGGLFNTNYIPELTELAKANVSFSQSDLIEGACVAPGCGWTIAGLVAETSGLPLKIVNAASDNTVLPYESFMPGAVTLGDILEEAGYQNYFMAGSDFDFGGRTKYFTQHGNYTILDYEWAKEEGKIASDYKVWWGFEDAKLFEFAKEELLELSQKDEPFNFSMLTVDTHMPSGYVCELCPDDYDEQYANVYACASAQISAFVSWVQEQDFYENTTIYICGDHSSMNSSFFGGLINQNDIYDTGRKVYNAFINPAVEPVQENNRQFLTLDMYPTVLASLGVEISGNRLGLGANLFSDEKTLAEEYGYSYVYAELRKRSSFYNSEILCP